MLKTINYIRVLGKFSRSFSVIFDTLWLIRSFSTGNCSWIPLIKAPVPGRSQFWISQKLRLLNHRSHCPPGLLPAENLHCLLEDLEFCGTRQRRWNDIKRTRVLKHPKTTNNKLEKFTTKCWMMRFSNWFIPVFLNVHGFLRPQKSEKNLPFQLVRRWLSHPKLEMFITHELLELSWIRGCLTVWH